MMCRESGGKMGRQRETPISVGNHVGSRKVGRIVGLWGIEGERHVLVNEDLFPESRAENQRRELTPKDAHLEHRSG